MSTLSPKQGAAPTDIAAAVIPRRTASSGHHNNYSPNAPTPTAVPVGKATSPSAPAPPAASSSTVRRPAPPAGGPSPLSPTARNRQPAATSSPTKSSTAAAPTKPRPKLGGATVTRRKPYRAPLSKKTLLLIKELLRAEEVARLELETQQSAEFTALGVSMQQSLMKLVNAHVQSGGLALAALRDDNEAQRAVNAEAKTAHADILQTVSVTSTVLKAFVDYHSSAEREYTRRLEIENAVMRRQLDAKDVEISRQFAELEGLRDSLSRLIIRTDVENEAYRRDVRAQIEANALDVAAMRTRLQTHIDDAVIAIHKPQFATALRSLADLVEEEQAKVQSSADELRYLVDQIGSEDRFLPRHRMGIAQRIRDAQSGAEAGAVGTTTDGATHAAAVAAGSGSGGGASSYALLLLANAGASAAQQEGQQSLSPQQLRAIEEDLGPSATMHTNYPRFYREQLQSLPKAALLRILDVISFEPRVVTAVGHALVEAATDAHVNDDDEEDEYADVNDAEEEWEEEEGAEERCAAAEYGAEAHNSADAGATPLQLLHDAAIPPHDAAEKRLRGAEVGGPTSMPSPVDDAAARAHLQRHLTQQGLIEESRGEQQLPPPPPPRGGLVVVPVGSPEGASSSSAPHGTHTVGHSASHQSSGGASRSYDDSIRVDDGGEDIFGLSSNNAN